MENTVMSFKNIISRVTIQGSDFCMNIHILIEWDHTCFSVFWSCWSYTLTCVLCHGNFGWTVILLHMMSFFFICLTHWGRVTHICVGNLTTIGSDNGLSPGRRQAIIWTNAGILLIGPLGTNFSELLIVIHTFSFSKMHLKMASAKWRPFCLCLNVLIYACNESNQN